MQILLDEQEFILYNVFRILSFFKHLEDKQRVKGTIQKIGGIDSEEEKISRYFYVVHDGGRRISRL